MKKYIINTLILLLFSTLSLFSQTWLWNLQIASSESLEPEVIRQDENGNYVILSELLGNVTIGGQTFSSTAPDKKDIIIISVNKYGNILWTKQIGNTYADDPKDLYVDNAGNIYLTGSFGDVLSIDDLSITATGSIDAFLLKLDKYGNVIWLKNMASNDGKQKGRAIISDGTYLYVAGLYYYNTLINKSADTTLEGTNKKNYYLAKYDLNGNLINAQRIFSSGNLGIMIAGMQVVGNYIYLAGYYSDTLIWGNDTLFSMNHTRDFMIAKVDENCNVVWVKSFPGTGLYDELWGLTNDGQDIYVSGYFQHTLQINNNSITANGSYDIFLSKIDGNGNIIWYHTINSSGDDRALTIYYKNGELYVGGLFSDTLSWGNINVVASNNTSPFIGLLDTSGNYDKCVAIQSDGSGKSRIKSLVVDETGHIYSVGKFNSNGLSFNEAIQVNNTNPGKYDGFIAKYGCFDGITLDVQDPGCSGPDDGSITANPNEGYGPFYYSWSNGETGQTITGLSEDDYTVTVTDDYGCSSTASAKLQYHSPLTITTQVDSEIMCYGDSTGQISVSASDGFPPYTYHWSNGETTQMVSNLPAGDYTVTVTDGCPNSVSETATLTQPDSLDATFEAKLYRFMFFDMCYAHITASVTGGTPDYSYEWYDLDGNQLGTDDNVWVDAGDYYIFIVRDANGCAAGWLLYVPSCSKNNMENDDIDTIGYPMANVEITSMQEITFGGGNDNVNTFGPGNLYSQIHSENNDNPRLEEALPEWLIDKLISEGKIKPVINVFPNPVKTTAKVSVVLPKSSDYSLYVTNMVGQTVKVLEANRYGNSQDYSFDTKLLSNGIYNIVLKTDYGIYQTKLTVLHK